MNIRKRLVFLASLFFLLLCASENSHAYIGPGAGFALVTSFLVIFVSLIIAVVSLLIWPFRQFIWMLTRKKLDGKPKAEKVVVVGLDGMDPDIAERFMSEGKLPHFQKLKDTGSFSRLGTTFPAVSPVAWSSFATSVNPGKHNIFDFLKPNRKHYIADLSSVHIGTVKRCLNIGKYKIPLGKPEIKPLRKSQPFWKVLGEYGIFSSILRVPITFPPEKFFGACLSAMCIPDLKGTQGSFTFYTSDPGKTGTMYEGERLLVEKRNGFISSYFPGPSNPILRKEEQMRIPFTVEIKDPDSAILHLSGQKIKLELNKYSGWIKLQYNAGLGIKVAGIARILLKSIEPHFSMYVTPINIDPEKPALPISHPGIFSVYHAKLHGSYSTLGLAEDTWALNERIINEDDFIKQAYDIQETREKMFFHTLKENKKGLVVTVFDVTDRLQHMFIRFLHDDHPALKGADVKKYKNVVEDLYIRMDELIGKTMDRLDDNTVLFVMSDHGFKPFKWGFHVNSWLHKEGYLVLKSGDESGKWFENVDWSKTRAYCLGMAGIYLNMKGREAKGIVNPDSEAAGLKKELKEKLVKIITPMTNQPVLRDVFDAGEVFEGPYKDEAPDLILGYHEGYRVSWDAAIGKVTKDIIEDNTKSWSADHCVDPRIVPGVLFSNRKVASGNPSIIDMGATILNLFGINPPAYMDGKNIMEGL
ncbi:MAG: alkaline phosphatase family protein [Nitrospirae bacterium]|nr:alkaline phosphatase family protein [Nitrospirota bacterium]